MFLTIPCLDVHRGALELVASMPLEQEFEYSQQGMGLEHARVSMKHFKRTQSEGN